MTTAAHFTPQQKLRILFITDTDTDGLAVTTFIEITRAMRKIGCAVEPVFLCHESAGNIPDVRPQHLLTYKFGSYFSSLRTYIKLIALVVKNRKRFDWIMTEPTSALFLTPLAMLRPLIPSIPKIVLDVRTQPVEVPDNWRGYITRKKFSMTIKAAARRFNGLLAITDEMAKYLKRITGIHMPVGIWTSGVNLELFKPDKPYERIPGIDGRFVIMYHGVFTPTRGLDMIILAIDKIRREYPEVLMFFLGDGSMREKMEAMVRERGLDNHVVICGPVPNHEIPRYLHSAHIGILAFPDHEWWSVQSPLKLFEYLAMSKPVIISDIPMNRNVVGNRNIAFYIKDNSAGQICEGIRTAVINREHLSAMGEEGRKLIVEEYSWMSQAGKINKYLLTV
ncbi:MAG TPA: glycosyltransferase [Smithella sp.]|nr:glycosyltransferase [Smithella sp.]